MKKFNIIYITSIFSFVFFVTFAHAQQTLTIGVEQGDSQPYRWFENDIPAGPDIEVMQELGKRTEIKFKFEYLPLEDMLKHLEKGSIDGVLAIPINPEIEKYATFLKPAPIHWMSMRFFFKLGTEFPLKTIEDLRGKMVGIVQGKKISGAFTRAERERVFFLDKKKDYTNMIKMNDLGRTDCFVGNSQAIQFHLSKMGLSEAISLHPTPALGDRPAYMAISKAATIENKETIIKKIEQAQKDMIKEGLFQKISTKYGFTYKP